MASKTAILAVKIVADAKPAAKGMDDAATGAQKFASRINKLTVPAGLALAAVVKLGKGAIDSASALEQSTGGVESVFKAHADEIKKYANDAADNVGLATSEYQDLATVIGAQLKNMGTPMEAVAGQTDNLVELGADLAATFGGSTSDAVSALSSLLRGERDPIERYGVSMNEAAIQARMAEMGLDGLSGEAEKNAKLQATLALLTEQTADAQGQFAREADTAAGAAQIAAAKNENMRASIGKGLLPIYTKFQQVLATVSQWLGQNAQAVTIVGGVIAGLAATVLVINGALRAYAAVQAIVKGAVLAWTGAQWLLNAAMTANPVGLIVAGIVALVAIVVVLWNNVEGFRTFVLAAWAAIRKAAEVAWKWIQNAVQVVIAALRAYINAYKSAVLAVWNAIKTAAAAVWNAIKAVVGAVVDAVKAYINGYKTVVLAVWSAISGAARTAWDAVKTTVSGAVDKIKGFVNTFKTVATGVWTTIRTTASTAFDKVREVIKSAMDKAKVPIDAVKAAFQTVRDMVNNVITAIGRIKFPSPPAWLSNLVGAGASSASGPSVVGSSPPASRILPPAASTSSGGGVSITVNGALDPDAVGRQIEDILSRRARRTGARSLGQGLFA